MLTVEAAFVRITALVAEGRKPDLTVLELQLCDKYYPTGCAQAGDNPMHWAFLFGAIHSRIHEQLEGLKLKGSVSDEPVKRLFKRRIELDADS